MNGNWSDYRINQLHRQNKMREAENHRLSRAAEGKHNPAGNHLAAILANLFSLIG